MEIGRDMCRVQIRQVEGEPEDSRRVFITAVVSSGREDGHGTIMSQRTLENFGRDLKTKIQFKDSHRMGQGFGVSTDGRYVADEDYVEGDFKLIRGWQLQNASYPTSDMFIDAIEEEVITRVSVGFSGGKRICNICDAESDYFRCFHWPGRKYEKIDAKTGKSSMVRCIVTIDDASLSEVSAVSRGSNPDAMITEKAERCLKEGRLPPEVQRELEDMYGMRFDSQPVIINSRKEEKTVEDKDVQERLAAVETERDGLKEKVAELEPLADCGREARKYITAQAVDALKLARGKRYTEDDKTKFEKRAENMTFADLLVDLEHFRSLAPEKPEVEAGSQTTQPDATRGEEGGETRQTQAFNPPWVGAA